jgi:LysM repeat protein
MIKRIAGLLAILIAFAMGIIIARMSMPYVPDEAAAFLASAIAGTKGAQTVAPQSPAAQGTVAKTVANTPTARPPTNTQAPTPTRPTLTPSMTRTATPLASFTPSKTLLPPPTLEPPTPTDLPTALASSTPTFTPFPLMAVPGLFGAESPTPQTTPQCAPRKDWKLTYTVKALDSLSAIAGMYGTNVDELAQGNCITNKNAIVVGQVLKVPGASQPETRWTCIPIQNLTPQNGTAAIAAGGSITFNWYGPRTPKNLIRIFAPDGTKIEYVVELRQDYQVDMTTVFLQGGTYTWYVYPLDESYRGVCSQGGPWTFTKPAAPTATPTTSVIRATVAVPQSEKGQP